MPGLTTEQIALYLKDMYKAEREGYKEKPTKYNLVYRVKTKDITGGGDKSTQILGAGTLVRHTTEDQKINFKSPVEGWTYYVKYHTFSDGIALSKNAVEDTVKLGNLIKDLSATWGRQVRIVKEETAALPFNNGGTLSGHWVFNGTHPGNTAPNGNMLYDNRPLFALSGNNHPTKVVASTATSGTGTLYNSVASLSLTPANFETIYNLHTATNNRDERNQIIENPADTLMTKAGSDEFVAKRLLESERLPFGELNDKNPYQNIVKPLAWAYLTDTASTFYVGRTQDDGFQFHERQLPELRFFRDEDDLGYKCSINLRIGILIKDWRVWTRGGGTSAA